MTIEGSHGTPFAVAKSSHNVNIIQLYESLYSKGIVDFFIILLIFFLLSFSSSSWC